MVALGYWAPAPAASNSVTLGLEKMNAECPSMFLALRLAQFAMTWGPVCGFAATATSLLLTHFELRNSFNPSIFIQLALVSTLGGLATRIVAHVTERMLLYGRHPRVRGKHMPPEIKDEAAGTPLSQGSSKDTAEYLTSRQFLRQYRKGRRNFAGIVFRRKEARFIYDWGGWYLDPSEVQTMRDVVLEDIDLSDADFTETNLGGTHFIRANLARAQFWQARLSHVKFHHVDLSQANFFYANCENAEFSDSVCNKTTFRGSDLTSANLIRLLMHDADIDDAILNDASLVECALGRSDGYLPLREARSFNGAQLDSGTYERSGWSLRDIQWILLSGAKFDAPDSVRERLLAALEDDDEPQDSAEPNNGRSDKIMLRSTFISYGSPDESFARKLYEALQRHGGTAFFFPEHAVPGEKLHRTMRKGVNEHDRVILVCSKASLDRKGVLNEIEETLARESRDGGAAYLVPIRLDDYVFVGWAPKDPGIAQAVRDRVVADFEGADLDQSKFDAQVHRLLEALKK